MDFILEEVSGFLEELWNEMTSTEKQWQRKEMIQRPGTILPEPGIKPEITG
jgi:hypothetical protein